MLLRDNVKYALLRSLKGNLQVRFKNLHVRLTTLKALFFFSFKRGWQSPQLHNGFSSRSIFTFTYTRI